MNLKTANIPAFVPKLNQASKEEKGLVFQGVESKGMEKPAYAYLYVPEEKRALDIVSWLVEKEIESEIQYVSKHQQFLVKIPNTETYSNDHFTPKHRPEDLVKIRQRLAMIVRQCSYEWAGSSSKVSKIILKRFEYEQDCFRIRTQGMKKLLFGMGLHCSDKSLSKFLVAEPLNHSAFIEQVYNWTDNCCVISASYTRRVINDLPLKVAEFSRLALTNLEAHTKASRMLNVLFQHGILIGQKLNMLSQDPQQAGCLERWEVLNRRCLVAITEAAKKRDETSFSFWQKESHYFMENYFPSMVGNVRKFKKDVFYSQKSLAEALVNANEASLCFLSRECDEIKNTINCLLRETTLQSEVEIEPDNDLNLGEDVTPS